MKNKIMSSMPYLNPDKCFVIPPPRVADEVIPLPEDWLELLIARLSSFFPEIPFKCHLQRHLQVGTPGFSSYLQALYQKLATHTSEDECKVIALRLIEDIEHCTPGFENRVKKILQELSFPPASLDAFLMQSRWSLITSAMRMNGDRELNHVENRFFLLANRHGYGVPVVNLKDKYRGMLSDDKILSVLAKAFKKHYQLPHILLYLVEQITTYLQVHYHYTGKVESSYEPDEYESFHRFLMSLGLNISKHDCFVVDEEHHSGVVDLNWEEIKLALFKTLCEKKYFLFTDPNQENLLRYLLSVVTVEFDTTDLVKKMTNRFIKNALLTSTGTLRALVLLMDPKRIDLQIAMINRFLDLKKKYSAIYRLVEVIDELKGGLSGYPVIQQFLEDYFLRNRFVFLEKDQNDNSILMDMVINQSKKQHFEMVLDLMTEEESEALLVATNHEGDDLLTLAAVYYPAMMPCIISWASVEVLRLLLSNVNMRNNTALLLASFYSPESAGILLDGMRQASFDHDEVLSAFKHSSKDENNVLLVAAVVDPHAVLLKQMVNYISEYSTDEKFILFAANSRDKYNLFLMTAYFQPVGLQFLFDSTQNFPLDYRRYFLTSKTRNGGNILSLLLSGFALGRLELRLSLCKRVLQDVHALLSPEDQLGFYNTFYDALQHDKPNRYPRLFSEIFACIRAGFKLANLSFVITPEMIPYPFLQKTIEKFQTALILNEDLTTVQSEETLLSDMSELAEKVTQFKKNGEKDAFAASEALFMKLCSIFSAYQISQNAADLKDPWINAIEEHTSILSQHRGCKDLLAKSAIALTGVGLLYLTLRRPSSQSQVKGKFPGFFAPLTDTSSAKILRRMRTDVEQICSSQQESDVSLCENKC